jgi:hypothetical protein
LGADAVVGFTSVAPIAHQTGNLEDGQVLGDHRLRDAGLISEGVHRLLAIARQALEDRSAGGIGKGSEQGIAANLHP